jgi:hypothetical protein
MGLAEWFPRTNDIFATLCAFLTICRLKLPSIPPKLHLQVLSVQQGARSAVSTIDLHVISYSA